MPGPPAWRTSILEHAVKNRKILPDYIDDRVRGVLGAVNWASEHSGIKPSDPEGGRNTAEDREFIRKVAGESMVLLKNEENILPWKKSEVKKLAIIGPNAKVATTHGGGSASVRSYYAVSPFEGLVNALKKENVEILYAPGVAATKNAPALAPYLRNADGKPGYDLNFYNCESDVIVASLQCADTLIYFGSSKPDGLEKDFRVTATATYTPESSGVHEFGLEVVGKAKLFINDELVVDNWTKQTWGSSFANDGSIEEVGQIKLERGVFYDFRIIFETGPDFGGDYVPQNVPMVEEGGGLRFGGGYKIDPDGGITEAVKIASEADHIVIFAGLNVSTIFCKC
jgi:beta-glucosidase